MFASRNDHIEIVKYLIEANMSLDIQSQVYVYQVLMKDNTFMLPKCSVAETKLV